MHMHTHAYTLLEIGYQIRQFPLPYRRASFPLGPGGRQAGPFLALAEKYFLGRTSAGKRSGGKEWFFKEDGGEQETLDSPPQAPKSWLVQSNLWFLPVGGFGLRLKVEAAPAHYWQVT